MSKSIDPAKKNVLIEEVLIQCVLALNHFNEARHLLADPNARQSRFVWAHLHAFLAQAALVSKMIAPLSKRSASKARSSELRLTLKIDDSSPVVDRAARNNVEHFDERLDLWLEHEGGSLLECVFDERSGFDFLFRDGRKPFVRRVLILEEMVLVTQGPKRIEETNLGAISDEIERIGQEAKAYLDSDKTVHRIYPSLQI
jgi:hypothetical protein